MSRVDFHGASPPRMSGMSQMYVEARKVLLDNKKSVQQKKNYEEKKESVVKNVCKRRNRTPSDASTHRSLFSLCCAFSLPETVPMESLSPRTPERKLSLSGFHEAWKNPRLAYARDVTRRKRAGKRRSVILDDSRYISINSPFWGTKISFVTL